MKESVDKKLDRLSRKMIEDAKLEQPSFNFTNQVLNSIQQMEVSKLTVYKPLISKLAWLIIAISFAALVFAIWVSGPEESSWLSNLEHKYLSAVEFRNPLAAIDLSSSMLYALLIFIGMLCIQFVFVKSYVNKRFRF